MRIAANRFAAIAVIGQKFGLIAHANLPHFDARVKLARQVADQFAKVDPFLGDEKEDEPLAAKEILDVDKVHLQFTVANESLAFLEGKLLFLVQLGEHLAIFGRLLAENLALGGFMQKLEG